MVQNVQTNPAVVSASFTNKYNAQNKIAEKYHTGRAVIEYLLLDTDNSGKLTTRDSQGTYDPWLLTQFTAENSPFLENDFNGYLNAQGSTSFLSDNQINKLKDDYARLKPLNCGFIRQEFEKAVLDTQS